MSSHPGIEVSVLLTVFNHAEYLERALDSVLAQVTNFKYEVIVGDDASSDRSAEILAAYADRHPGVFKVTYRPVNLGGTRNFTDLVRQCQGRYLAFLEGDDHWIDPQKLQTQYDFLGAESRAFAVSHQINVCDHNNRFMYLFPPWSHRETSLTISSFMRGKKFPLTATMLRLAHTAELETLLRLVEEGSRNAGDTTICLYLLHKSPIHMIQKPMSVYQSRSVAGHSNYNSITRFSQKVKDRLNIISVNDAHYQGQYNFAYMYVRLAGTLFRALLRLPPLKETLQLLLVLPSIALALLKTVMRRARHTVRQSLTRKSNS